MSEIIKNEKVIIDTELATFTANIDDVNTKIESAEKISDITNEIILLKNIENAMDISEADFDKAVKAAKAKFLERKKMIQNTLESVKEKAIKEAEESMVVKETFKNNFDEDGVLVRVKTTKTYNSLPKGVVYKKGKMAFEYDESKVPFDEKYFKTTLKKTAVKKDWESGELPNDVVIPKPGKPSISIDKLAIEKGMDALEKKEGDDE